MVVSIVVNLAQIRPLRYTTGKSDKRKVETLPWALIFSVRKIH